MIKSTEVDDLATRIGRLMKFWGLKEVHGRVWTLIYLSESALTSLSIMKILQLSKSATNMALAELSQFDLICCSGIESTRHKLYKTDLSLNDVLARIFSKKNSRLLDEINESIGIVQKLADKEQSGIMQHRIDDLLQSSAALANARKAER